MAYRLKAYTGPAWVHQRADQLKEADIKVVLEGTESIYVDQDGSSIDAAINTVHYKIRAYFGRDLSLKFTSARVYA